MEAAEVEVAAEGAEAVEQLEHPSAHHRCHYQVRRRFIVGLTRHATITRLVAEPLAQDIDSIPL